MVTPSHSLTRLTACTQVLPLLPGTHFDIAQTVDASGMPAERAYKVHVQQQQQAGAAGGVSVPSPGHRPTSSGGGPPAAEAVAATAVSSPGGAAGPGQPPSSHELVLVVFIGGVTYSEISALRFLASRPGSRQR